MIPTVVLVLSHFGTDLFEGATDFVLLNEELAIAVVTAFHFPEDIVGDWLAAALIDIADIMEVVHVGDEPAHLLGDFRLRLA